MPTILLHPISPPTVTWHTVSCVSGLHAWRGPPPFPRPSYAPPRPFKVNIQAPQLNRSGPPPPRKTHTCKCVLPHVAHDELHKVGAPPCPPALAQSRTVTWRTVNRVDGLRACNAPLSLLHALPSAHLSSLQSTHPNTPAPTTPKHTPAGACCVVLPHIPHYKTPQG